VGAFEDGTDPVGGLFFVRMGCSVVVGMEVEVCEFWQVRRFNIPGRADGRFQILRFNKCCQ
jgi:hypothetical protein